jgi:hypothetical protein
MARGIVEVGAQPEIPQDVSAGEMQMRLTLVAREAAFVARLAGELQAGRLAAAELPALLENLGARLTNLANPASPWRGIGLCPRIRKGD